MTRPPIAKESQALLDLISPSEGSETTPHTDQLYEMVGPLHDVIDHITARIAAIERALHLADATETGAYAYGFFERLQASCGGAMREARNVAENLRSLTNTCYAIDQCARDMAASLDTYEARTKSAADRTAGMVVLSSAEHAALLDRLAQAEARKPESAPVPLP